MVNWDKLADVNRRYDDEGLDVATMHADPLEQFQWWFEAAARVNPAEANAMSLATSLKNGRCSVRTVLLKSFDVNGFVFFTNYQSRKGKELAENPWAALNFHWRELQRDVRVEGTVTQVPGHVSEAYFHSRPKESQVAALASAQSAECKDRQEVMKVYDELWKQYQHSEVPCPKHWGGYCVKPVAIEFWQGRINRLHDRVLYVQDDRGSWVKKRLYP